MDMVHRNMYFNRPEVRPRLVAYFHSHPPDDLRKSNFFNFSIGFKNETGEPLEIEKVKFLGYINENHELDFRNGIQYSMEARFSNGYKETVLFRLTLVDSATREIVRYEGSDDGLKSQRVLLTHETICSRCSDNKSCGNKNEAPSDPMIIDRGVLKFFMKCNQNCLKSAGNPKQMRRFSMALSLVHPGTNDFNLVAVSKKMFVHNNSKHSKKRKKEGVEVSTVSVAEVFPKEGPVGTRIAVFGSHFYHGLQVCFGSVPVKAEVKSENVMYVTVPALPLYSSCPLFLRFGNNLQNMGYFKYVTPPPPQSYLACVHPKVGVRGEEFVLYGGFLRKESVVMCNGVPLETTFLEAAGVTAVIPTNMVIGPADIVVYNDNQQICCFKYNVRDRNRPGYSPLRGFLILDHPDQPQSANLIPCDSGYSEPAAYMFPAGDYRYDLNSPATSSSTSGYGSSPTYCKMSPGQDSA